MQNVFTKLSGKGGAFKTRVSSFPIFMSRIGVFYNEIFAVLRKELNI